MPQGRSHETTELKLLFLNERYADLSGNRQVGTVNRGRLLVSALFGQCLTATSLSLVFGSKRKRSLGASLNANIVAAKVTSRRAATGNSKN
jgi:hypothetical protein